jgi:triacylglycerol lipase
MEKGSRMTFLSFLAYSDFWNCDLTSLQENVATDLLNYSTELDFSEISWGPVAHQENSKLPSDSLMYIVKDSIDSAYTLVIRGTNPVSISSWIFQDLMVSGLTPWGRQSPTTKSENAYISKATDNSLAIHKSLTCDGQSVLDWIITRINADGTIKLNVTGHSLGGLMSPTFANYLLDELSSRSLGGLIDCNVYALAGPTAGTSEYVKQLNFALNDKFVCYENYYDIATHVWAEKDMRDVLPGLYAEKGIHLGKYEEMALKYLTEQIHSLGYTKLPNVHTIKSDVIPFSIFNDYILQAIYQHVFPYLIWAMTPPSMKVIERILEIILHMIDGSEIVTSDGRKILTGDQKNIFREQVDRIISEART